MFYRAHPRVTLDCGDTLITKQSHKAECDIYNILKQYQRTGIITHVQSARPQYTDLPSDVDYQSALNLMLEAEQTFLSLPARVRDHFNNDPERFLAAFRDDKQADKLREFGLLQPLRGDTARATASGDAAVAGAAAPPAAPEAS